MASAAEPSGQLSFCPTEQQLLQPRRASRANRIAFRETHALLAGRHSLAEPGGGICEQVTEKARMRLGVIHDLERMRQKTNGTFVVDK